MWGEFYNKYDKLNQHKGPFANCLEQCDIVTQFAISEQDEVVERHTRNFMDMVRIMTNQTDLPERVCGESLKITVCILNRVSVNLSLKLLFNFARRKIDFMSFSCFGLSCKTKDFYGSS